jgi:hypothetical protein
MTMGVAGAGALAAYMVERGTRKTAQTIVNG